jgi:hypothetical protein
MYGVTMQEPGVSSIVSVTLDERLPAPPPQPAEAPREPAAVG